MGNTRTDPAVIRRELQFREGQPLGQEALIESQRRLSALGLFRRVRIAPLPHGSPNNPDVIVTVEEALRTTIGYGGGAEIDRVLTAGPEGQAQEDLRVRAAGLLRDRPAEPVGKEPNGQPLHPAQPPSERQSRRSAVVRLHRIPRRRHLPRAQSGARPGRLTLTAAIEQGRRTSFNFSRKGVNAEFSRRLTDLTRGSFRYSFGTTRTFDEQLSHGRPADDRPRCFPQVRLSAFSVAVSRDTRDDLLEPQHGTFVGRWTNAGRACIGSQVGYTKSYLAGVLLSPARHSRIWCSPAERGSAWPIRSRRLPSSKQTRREPDTVTVKQPAGQRAILRWWRHDDSRLCARHGWRAGDHQPGRISHWRQRDGDSQRRVAGAGVA